LTSLDTDFNASFELSDPLDIFRNKSPWANHSVYLALDFTELSSSTASESTNYTINITKNGMSFASTLVFFSCAMITAAAKANW